MQYAENNISLDRLKAMIIYRAYANKLLFNATHHKCVKCTNNTGVCVTLANENGSTFVRWLF